MPSLRLSSLLDPGLIRLDLPAPSRTDAVLETAALLRGHPDMVDFDEFLRDLQARERVDTTDLGNGVALPHARTAGVRRTVAAVGRRYGGWPGESGSPVRLMFVLGTPRDNPGDYLALVGSLCRIIKKDTDHSRLLAAPTPRDFIATVVAIEQRVLGPAA